MNERYGLQEGRSSADQGDTLPTYRVNERMLEKGCVLAFARQDEITVELYQKLDKMFGPNSKRSEARVQRDSWPLTILECMMGGERNWWKRRRAYQLRVSRFVLTFTCVLAGFRDHMYRFALPAIATLSHIEKWMLPVYGINGIFSCQRGRFSRFNP